MEERKKLLVATVKKLYHREARHNIQKIFIKTHEADIAFLLERFESGERYDLFCMEPSFEKRAGVLSRLDLDLQKELLSCMGQQEILRLLSLMDSDDVADLLGQLPKEESQGLLSAMLKEDSEDVTDLMGYPEDSAGGLMNSDFLALNQNLSVHEAIQKIQDEDKEIGVAFYIYVVNDSDKLVGVISLKQLLLSRKTDLLKTRMFTDVIAVSVETGQEKVAKTVEHYDFLSLPVVDHSNHLVGVITVDDVIDVIREEAEEDLLTMGQAGSGYEATTFERLKARLGWLAFAFLGGLGSFFIVYSFSDIGLDSENQSLRVLAAYIPLLLSIGATTGSQAATVTVAALRVERFDRAKFFPNLLAEFVLGIFLSVAFGFMVWCLGKFVFVEEELAILMAIAMSIQVLISIVLGNVIPVVADWAGIDSTATSVPVCAAIADVLAMAVLFGLYQGFY